MERPIALCPPSPPVSFFRKPYENTQYSVELYFSNFMVRTITRVLIKDRFSKSGVSHQTSPFKQLPKMLRLLQQASLFEELLQSSTLKQLFLKSLLSHEIGFGEEYMTGSLILKPIWVEELLLGWGGDYQY